jgi:hypothetical protein
VTYQADEGDDNLIPPRIFTEEYSINHVTFEPKPKPNKSGGLEIEKTLFNKDAWMTMPSGTAGFYFLIGGNIETALFDTRTEEAGQRPK